VNALLSLSAVDFFVGSSTLPSVVGAVEHARKALGPCQGLLALVRVAKTQKMQITWAFSERPEKTYARQRMRRGSGQQ
jgi:hypothetical protein